jgi:hypothetical protein
MARVGSFCSDVKNFACLPTQYTSWAKSKYTVYTVYTIYCIPSFGPPCMYVCCVRLRINSDYLTKHK